MSRKVLKGIYLSDIHLSSFNPVKTDAIDLTGVLRYINEFEPDIIILGGDIIDAKGLHGVESFRASQFKMEWYQRDCKLLKRLLLQIDQVAPKVKIVYLEGNHEERYSRLIRKYPDQFKKLVNLMRDGVPAHMRSQVRWIPYGTYKSYYQIGDALFIHGTIYPHHHAHKYAEAHAPYKVWYGHIHDMQLHSLHTAGPGLKPKYAGTAGCLAKRCPEWKKGFANKWVNGFADFVSVDGTTSITPHIIENGIFQIGGKLYEGKGRGHKL